MQVYPLFINKFSANIVDKYCETNFVHLQHYILSNLESVKSLTSCDEIEIDKNNQYY